ncbi:MAG: hypothetical protein AAFV45_15675, partial [Pseudomonadota bacterium]
MRLKLDFLRLQDVELRPYEKLGLPVSSPGYRQAFLVSKLPENGTIRPTHVSCSRACSGKVYAVFRPEHALEHDTCVGRIVPFSGSFETKKACRYPGL